MRSEVPVHVSPPAGPSTYVIAADAEIVALRDAIMACNYAGSGNIELPRGVQWPTLESSTLFVRHFYAPLVDTVFKRFEAPHLNYLVVGNPGIAKSAFGLYVLFRALREGRDVIFLAGELQAGFHFRHNVGGGSVRKFLLSDTLRFTSACSARDVLISDSWTPPLCRAFTVLISSPQRERYKELQKQPNWRTLFFPVFSKEEIDAMARACFPQLLATADGVAGVEERYHQWGGVPRYVLANVDDVSQALLRDAIAAVTVPRLKGSVSAEGIEAATSHHVVHIKTAGEVAAALPPDAWVSLRNDIVAVTAPRLQASISAEAVNATASHHVVRAADLTPATLQYYFPIKTELGSPFIIEELYQRLLHERRTELFAFLDSSTGNPRLASLRRQVFELAALERLAAGGVFHVRRLTRGSGRGEDIDVKLPSAVTARFDTAAALADVANRVKLMRPASKTYAAIDAVLPAHLGVANFTLSETHDVIIDSDEPDGLAAVAAAQGWGTQGELPLYWVVPDDVYAHFEVGGFMAVTRAGGSIDAAGVAAGAAPISAEAASAAAAALTSSIAAGPVRRRRLKAAEVAVHPLASRVVQYALRIPPFQRARGRM